jgi:hypothetical protein
VVAKNKNNMKYDLNQDAITKKPNFFGRGSKALVTLEEAKEITKKYFTECYDFNSKLKEYIYNVDKCKDVLAVQRYIEYAAIKGLTIKTKINLNKLK